MLMIKLGKEVEVDFKPSL